MAANPSFDIVSKVDRQEVDNALNQAAKELATRFDFRGTDTTIGWKGDEIRVSSKKRDDLQAVIAMLKGADLDVALQFVNYR